MSALVNPFWFGDIAGDPHWANVVLLWHCEGANGSTGSFIESSASGKTVSQPAGTSLTTAQFRFGTASVNIPGTSNYALVADSLDWHFAAGPFTVEAFIRPTAATAGQRTILAQTSGAAGNLSWLLYYNNTSGVFAFAYSANGTAYAGSATGTYTPPLNTWTHVAADRDASNVLRVYADGVLIGSATAAATFFNSNQGLGIGNRSGGTEGLIGQMDEVRITKGVARYAGAFTPPSAPFPDF